MKNAIITGITGQDGSHLADLLLSKNYKVIGITRRTSTDNTKRIKHILNNENFSLVEGDVTDQVSIFNILRDNAHVDEIYNLAAQSHVGTSFKQPGLTWDITAKGCMNVLQAIVDTQLFNVRFYQASSSEMFGDSYDININGEKYQNEETKFLPQSPYAISKCAAHYSVRLFREAYNLHASSGILFNHEGPRRGDNFVTKKIINWIADFSIWLNKNKICLLEVSHEQDMVYGPKSSQTFPKLRLGNIEAYRDWGYAPDYVEAMWLMLQQDYADDYVICTGNTYQIKDFLEISFAKLGIKRWENYVLIDPKFYRPADVNYLKGDNSKAKNKLGWQPRHNLHDLVTIMLEQVKDEKLQNNVRLV